MSDYIVIILLTLGTIFIFLAALGMLRMPDVFLRMSASSIAATLGASIILTALAFYYFDLGITFLVVGINLFLFLTVPVSSHLMGRAAHKAGYQKWNKTLFDRLEGKYDLKNNRVLSGLEDIHEGAESNQEVK